MAGYRLRPKAKRDIERIADYTFEQWGERQEEAYLKLLKQALEALVENPEIGRSAEELSTGLRKFKAGRHLIFYLDSMPGIDVVRILHQSMDFERHL